MKNKLNKIGETISNITDSKVTFEYDISNDGYKLLINDNNSKVLLKEISLFNNENEFNELIILIVCEMKNINLKFVKRPLQDEFTKLDEIQYPNEKWCVKTSIYREGDGGIKLWFKEIERIKPDIVYFHKIESWKDKIVNGLEEKNWFEDTLYQIRYDFKKFL